jgi:large subunit ribosomal protein L21
MKTYAIIEAGGEQLQVQPGRFYDIRLSIPENEFWENRKIIFSRVLMIRSDSSTFFGKPWLEGAAVKARIFHPRRGNKLIVYTMRPKKHTSKKNGHRQLLIRVLIDSIFLNNQNFGDMYLKDSLKQNA